MENTIDNNFKETIWNNDELRNKYINYMEYAFELEEIELSLEYIFNNLSISVIAITLEDGFDSMDRDYIGSFITKMEEEIIKLEAVKNTKTYIIKESKSEEEIICVTSLSKEELTKELKKIEDNLIDKLINKILIDNKHLDKETLKDIEFITYIIINLEELNIDNSILNDKIIAEYNRDLTNYKALKELLELKTTIEKA